jgi:drug/metabolite transporter (DMT)-like permease
VTPTVLGIVLGSALLHASWSAAIKGARSPMAFNVIQAALWTVAGFALCLTFEPGDLAPATWALVAATGIAHALYFYFLTRALERADLTVVYPIVRSTPALLPFLAVPLLGEQLTWVGGLGIAIVVAGVWAVYAEGRNSRDWLAPDLAFAWLTLATTVAYSLLDKAGIAALDAGPWSGPLPRALAWFALLSAAHGPPFLLLAARRVRREQVFASLRHEVGRATLSAVVAFVGYGLILEAFRSASASYVVAVRQTSVLFAVGIAMIFLGERPSRRRLLGAAATVIGVALIAVGG